MNHLQRWAVFVVLCGALSAPAWADTPATAKSVKELLALTGASAMGVQVMKAMMPAFKQGMPQVPDAFWEEFMNQVDPNEMIDLIVPIYQRHFTESEVRDVITFFNSPTGKKFVQQQPAVMQESMAAGQQWGQSLARRAMEKLEKSDAAKSKTDNAKAKDTPHSSTK